MSTIEEMIESMRERMGELQPAVDEHRQLSRMIAAAELEHLRETDPEGFELRKKSRYMSLKDREEQIRALEEQNPEATNAWIATRVGLTASRVSQIRSKGRKLKKGDGNSKHQQKLEGMPENPK